MLHFALTLVVCLSQCGTPESHLQIANHQFSASTNTGGFLIAQQVIRDYRHVAEQVNVLTFRRLDGAPVRIAPGAPHSERPPPARRTRRWIG